MELFGVITVGGTLAVVIVCLILYSVIQKKRHFLCPRCGARFKVGGMRSFFVSRQGTDRMLTCPRCGITVYMENVHDEDYTDEMKKLDEEKWAREARERAEDEQADDAKPNPDEED